MCVRACFCGLNSNQIHKYVYTYTIDGIKYDGQNL